MKNIKRLKKLLKLQSESEAQIRVEGFTPETLKETIKEQKNQIRGNLNSLGWILMFLIFIPLALMQLGMSSESAFFTSYISGGIIALLLDKLNK